MEKLTHFNDEGHAHMVDVTEKAVTNRYAIAEATVKMKKETLELILASKLKKGDVLGVAQIAGIMGAKKTSDIIPMCHQINLSGVDIRYEIDRTENSIHILCKVKTSGQTGVEMEAMTGAAVCAVTIYDMCKSVDRFMEITDMRLLEKDGGKSGLIKKE